MDLVCHAIVEAEANYAAAQLLFLQQRFSHEARDGALEFKAINAMSKRFGNTLTTTLWRMVEDPVLPTIRNARCRCRGQWHWCGALYIRHPVPRSLPPLHCNFSFGRRVLRRFARRAVFVLSGSGRPLERGVRIRQKAECPIDGNRRFV